MCFTFVKLVFSNVNCFSVTSDLEIVFLRYLIWVFISIYIMITLCNSLVGYLIDETAGLMLFILCSLWLLWDGDKF